MCISASARVLCVCCIFFVSVPVSTLRAIESVDICGYWGGPFSNIHSLYLSEHYSLDQCIIKSHIYCGYVDIVDIEI